MSRIVQLDIQNVMRVNAVHIEPDGHVVILGGKNAQGKTSVLDSISMAIGGARLCPDVPIKEGEDTAEISLTLGDLAVTRKFKRDGDSYRSSLTVKNANGEPVAQPQKTLDALIGKLAFDPLAFARMAPARAREVLRDLVGLDVEQLEEKLGNVYRKRHEAGQEKRAAQAVVDELPVPPETEQPISVDLIMQELEAGAERQREFEELKGISRRKDEERNNLSAEARRLRAERMALTERIDQLDGLIDEANRIATQAAAAVNGFVLPSTGEAQTRLVEIQTHNQRIAANDLARERYREKTDQAEEKAEAWKALDAEHNQIENEIKKLTEAIEYPIDGLELRREGVYYQGVPFDQGSLMERIKVSTAMGCAMNKELGIILIRDGSVLDDEAMTFFCSFAEEKQMQFWIEMARGYEGREGVVVIDDGGVA